MAKDQDLPLNPQKISGLCGRLLCCLSYEDDGYREMRKTLPKIGQRCSTPTGEGKAIAVNILRRQVTLIVDGKRVEVGDRDLGLVVRWDTSSKANPPPPSLTPEEAVEQGLMTREEADAWVEAGREAEEAAAYGGEGGRGRLPVAAPRKIARPRPAPASPGAPGARPARRSGPPARQGPETPEAREQREPRQNRGRGREGAAAPRPDTPIEGARTRTFRRTGGADTPPGASPERTERPPREPRLEDRREPRPDRRPPSQGPVNAPAPADPSDAGTEGDAPRGRRRRRGRGGRGGGGAEGGSPAVE